MSNYVCMLESLACWAAVKISTCIQIYCSIVRMSNVLSLSQNPCDRNVLEELSSGQLQFEVLSTSQAPPTQQVTTPTEPEFGEEIDTGEDFDLEDDLNLDELDLNTDVSLPWPHSHSSIIKATFQSRLPGCILFSKGLRTRVV